MHYIVGLGNPGDTYADTRHNAGWLMLDAFIEAHALPSPYQSSKLAGRVSEGVVRGQEVSCLFPDTYMNKTGSAVKKLVPKGAHEQLIVVYDDIDLPVGSLKVSFGRGAGGHNGVASVIGVLGTKEFARVRIGVAAKTVWPWESGDVRRPKGAALPRFVLKPFTKKERQELEALAPTVVAAITDLIVEGPMMAMNRFN